MDSLWNACVTWYKHTVKNVVVYFAPLMIKSWLYNELIWRLWCTKKKRAKHWAQRDVIVNSLHWLKIEFIYHLFFSGEVNFKNSISKPYLCISAIRNSWSIQWKVFEISVIRVWLKPQLSKNLWYFLLIHYTLFKNCIEL